MEQKGSPSGVTGAVKAYHAIMSDLASKGISKDRTNKHQGFNFRGIDQIYQVLTPILVAHHLIVVPAVTNMQVHDIETASGKAATRVIVKVKYTFICEHDGSVLDMGEYVGEGQDTGDKATSKALSMAYKYFMIHAFGIPVEPGSIDDGDSDTPEARGKSRTRAKPAKEAPPVDGGGDDMLESLKCELNAAATMDALADAWKAAAKAARNRNREDWLDELALLKDTRKKALVDSL